MLISKGHIPVAAIVSVDDLERLNQLDAEREADFAIFDQIAAKFQDQSVEEIERAVAEAIAQVRAEKQAEYELAGSDSTDAPNELRFKSIRASPADV